MKFGDKVRITANGLSYSFALALLPFGTSTSAQIYSYVVQQPNGAQQSCVASQPGSSQPSGYAPNGNLTNYCDSVTGTWAAQYDSLNRLKDIQATAGIYNGLDVQWQYDSFGNRLSQTPSGSTANLPPATTMQYSDSTNRITTSSIPGVNSSAYDAAGNLHFDGLNSIAYDAESRICAVKNSAGTVTQYLYNAEGQRVAKGYSSSGAGLVCPTLGDFVPTEKYILGQSGEQITQLNGSDVWQYTNVYANAELIATYDQEGSQQPLHFHISDPLGTRRVQTSASGGTELSFINLPYGDGFTPSGSGEDATQHHFTGKERDAESGLDYFPARYYASSMARFMSPDDGNDPNRSDPQSWNLYSYGRNSPLINIDPSGQDCVYADGQGGGYLLRGDCASDTDNGIFVNGTVDANSFKYNPANNSSSFSYTPDGAGPGAIGTGVIQGPNLNGGFDAGSLGAAVFGSQSASTWRNAAGVVNAAGTAELTAASFISTPAALAGALSSCSSTNASCAGKVALAGLSGGLGALGRGLTGTRLATTVAEQLALEEAVSNPAAGKVLTNIFLKDPRWPATAGWVKKELTSPGGIVVHWVYNTITGAAADFKLK